MSIQTKAAQEAYFEVEVAFGNDDEGASGPCSIPNGTWRGLAKDETTAKDLAYKECWDRRLDITGCYPLFKCKEIPRYLASPGWGHIFVGNREETTRWIYDAANKKLVSAQVLNASTWVNLDVSPMADLLQSIHDNDAVDDADEWDLIHFYSVPSWQEVEACLESTAANETPRG